jgi:hypothetical protein
MRSALSVKISKPSSSGGKLYPWVDEEYGPPPRVTRDRDPKQVARERAEILRAQIDLDVWNG